MATAIGGDITLQLMTTVAELKLAMGRQSEQMTDISAQFTETAAKVSKLSADMQNNLVQFGRVATLVADLAEDNARRHEDLEARVEVLERKASGQ